MAKNENSQGVQDVLQAPPAGATWYTSFRVQAIIVALLALVCYCNTFKHEYALDDTIVIVRNEFVHQGLAGIPGILTHDTYFCYYDQLKSTNQLSGGRYRPLSVITFAIEQQVFGAIKPGQPDSIIEYGLNYGLQEQYEQKFAKEMHVRHIMNVAWYMLAVVVLLCFLRYVVFPGSPLSAFLAAVLFAVHPIHTEVVANVKSRDEIMSLLFICLTFITAFRYRRQGGGPRWLGLALLCFFLALLAKEYAITLVLLLPLSFYVLGKETAKKSLLAVLPYLGVALLYLAIRWQLLGPRADISDTDIQINPYAYASATEHKATVISTSLNYLKLLIFPHPLSSDYSYNQIPYKDFSSPIVWLSLAVHIGLVVGLFYYLKKRSVLCFAIAFYLFNLLMVNNFLFALGATMGERLIFHSSVGFVLAVAYGMVWAKDRIKPVRTGMLLLAAAMVVIVVAGAWKTIDRNPDWKNDETLFMQDVHTSPNSFLVNVNVATMLVNRSDLVTDEKQRTADLRRGVQLFTRAIGMQDNYVLGYMNRSVGYLKLGQPDSMMKDLDRVMVIYPLYPSLPEMYYHAGVLYMSGKDYAHAAIALGKSLQLNPNAPVARAALDSANAAMHPAGETNSGIKR